MRLPELSVLLYGLVNWLWYFHITWVVNSLVMQVIIGWNSCTVAVAAAQLSPGPTRADQARTWSSCWYRYQGVYNNLKCKSKERKGSHALQWPHNEHDGVSNHKRLDCSLSRLFKRKSKKTLKFVTGQCEENSSVTTQRSSNAEDVYIWLRHHVSCAVIPWGSLITTRCTGINNRLSGFGISSDQCRHNDAWYFDYSLVPWQFVFVILVDSFGLHCQIPW